MVGKHGLVLVGMVGLLLGMFPMLASGWVMGIDMGSESYKVALVRPRFDIALNEQSSRKTPSLVAYHQGDLFIGTDAKNLKTRVPGSVYSNVHLLMGKSWGDAQVTQWIEEGKFQYKLVEHNGGYGIYVDEEITFKPEDIIAMMLSNAKQIASKSGGTTIRDCVITVPAFYTQAQRQSLLDAAKIAGLNVLSLINDVSAVAINWGMDRTFDLNNATYTVIYDMGHASTSVAVLSYKAAESKKNKTSTQIVVQSIAWDSTLGGEEFDKRIVGHFLKVIQKQHNIDVSKDQRAMAKLFKEAQRVKEVLSANTVINVGVEGLTSSIDFKSSITRETFEEACSDLFERALTPITTALKNAEIDKSQVEFFEIVGGGVRIPKLQQKMKEFLNREELDKHLNGDEAAVMGAVFFGASQSPAFVAKEIKLKDFFPFKSSVTFSGEDLDKSSELFNEGSRLATKKSLTFYTNDNFTVEVKYDKSEALPPNTKLLLGKYYVSNLPSKERYNFTGNPKIHAGFRLTSNGLVNIDKVEAEITVTEVKLVPVKKEKIETESKKTEEPAAESTDETKTGEEAETETEPTESTPEAAQATEAAPEAATEMEEKISTKVHRVALKVAALEELGLVDSDFTHSKKIMADINTRMELKREKEREKNTLESYTYEMRDKLETEEVIQVTTQEQRDSFAAELAAAGEWLDDEGQNAETSQYRKKTEGLKATGDKILKRISELTARPAAIEYAHQSLDAITEFLQNVTQIYDVTEEDKDEALETVKEFQDWLHKKEEEQSAKAVHEDAVITSDQIMKRMKSIESKVKPLFYKKKKAPPKPAAPETTTESTSTEQSDTTSDSKEDTQSSTEEPQQQEEKKHDEL